MNEILIKCRIRIVDRKDRRRRLCAGRDLVQLWCVIRRPIRVTGTHVDGFIPGAVPYVRTNVPQTLMVRLSLSMLSAGVLTSLQVGRDIQPRLRPYHEPL